MKKLEIVLTPLLVLVVIIGAIGCAAEEGTPTPALTPTPTPPALFLEITEPEDESVVSTASIPLSGSTIPGAVVSVLVNDKIEVADVDENGSFTVMVTLEEGPNLIEVIASDWEGNEVGAILTVIYNL